MSRPLAPPSLDDIRAARERIRGTAIRTPLLRLNADAPAEIWLKCENLQPIGSFKIRGAANKMARLSPESLHDGVYTASAGNMAQGVAWCARRLQIPCAVVVPEHAPETKLRAIERLGASVMKVPFEAWWRAFEEHRYPGMRGTFVHAFSDRDVIAGNGTIALEILEDLPDVDAVVVPYGGGGLSTGIATGMRALRPEAPVIACEVATAAPLAASLQAKKPRSIDYTPSFVDGIGGKSVFEEIWPLASGLLAGSLVVTLEEAAEAVRLLLTRNRLLAEGAGAVPVAAALQAIRDSDSRLGGARRIVCVVSGGNIDPQTIAAILAGSVP